MARIRTIKPEFFTSEDITSLTPLARLFYVSLWCEADRDGRISWRPVTLKQRYLPADSVSIDALAGELISSGLVILYEIEGKTYAEIPSFKNHQVINNRESESILPARVKVASPRVKAEGRKGREGKEGKGRDSTEPQSASMLENSVIQIPLVDQTEHPITQSQIDEWSESFPAVDVIQQLRSMRQWCIAHPSRRKTSRGVSAFMVSWLTKEQDKGRSKGPDQHNSPFAGGM